MLRIRATAMGAVTVVFLGLSACTTEQVIDNTVDVAAGTTKIVAKGAVAVGKATYKGAKSLVSDDE